ncbi:MAG TPA: methyltransferase domain-containing protein [Candidatus Sulfotelmatobacter sp.]
MSGTAIPVSVAEGYERWAATYDRNPNPLLAREERHLLPLIVQSKGERILDVACGTGRWMKRLSECRAVFGIDNSNAMLQIARCKAKATPRFAQGACEQMPFRDRAFDGAVCSFALAHFSALNATAKELARVLQPGSDLFITDLHPEAIAQGWRVGFRDGSDLLEIETSAHPATEIVRIFCAEGFGCVAAESLWLGEEERELFDRSGRRAHFRQACAIPAVIVFQFKRAGVARNHDTSERALA